MRVHRGSDCARNVGVPARTLPREGMEEEEAPVKSENGCSEAGSNSLSIGAAEVDLGAAIAARVTAGVPAAGVSAAASAEDGTHAPAANAGGRPPKSGLF